MVPEAGNGRRAPCIARAHLCVCISDSSARCALIPTPTNTLTLAFAPLQAEPLQPAQEGRFSLKFRHTNPNTTTAARPPAGRAPPASARGTAGRSAAAALRGPRTGQARAAAYNTILCMLLSSYITIDLHITAEKGLELSGDTAFWHVLPRVRQRAPARVHEALHASPHPGAAAVQRTRAWCPA